MDERDARMALCCVVEPGSIEMAALVAEHGPAQEDFDPLFAALDADVSGAFDAVRDNPNMPMEQEPARVQNDLQRLMVH